MSCFQMLEGAVARILNQLLGKYVVDLDTENLNVGIFSGLVQLTDLKLKPEALYDLKLPIEVIAGTIGKLSIQIPWTTIWDSTTVINVEDVFILANPVVNGNLYDEEKDKMLRRAQKRKVLADLDSESHFIGGPSSFSEHLVSNILNNLQLNISRVHIRYEDKVSCVYPLAAGITIESITAETTNSKWKSAPNDSKKDKNFYLIKIDCMSVYWNQGVNIKKWEFPSEYYTWKNAMVCSVQLYSFVNEKFDFLLRPTNCKFKITMDKSTTGNIQKIVGDFNIQDCLLQMSKKQYDSICSTADSLKRMHLSWEFLGTRPKERISVNKKAWWRYAHNAVLEQRVKPYKWSSIKRTREIYRQYVDTYKQIIQNPNDTELKLDLQKHEDRLSVLNVVIARQHSRLLMKSTSIGEKNFWSMLPSPERLILCEKIGFFNKSPEDRPEIDHKINFRIGNLSATLLDGHREVAVLTATQANLTWVPNFTDNLYNVNLKVEGFILEGNTDGGKLVTLASSEHLSTSPAYFLRVDFAKLPGESKASHKLRVNMDSVEMVYHEYSLDCLWSFLDSDYLGDVMDIPKLLSSFYALLEQKLRDNWEMEFNVKIPFLVVPDNGDYLGCDNLLIVDLGKHLVLTEICQKTEIDECATQMELEEQLYTKLTIESSDIQVLLCDSSDNWREAKDENDSDLHIVPKCGFSATTAYCVQSLKTIPNFKFSVNFSNFKLNVSERKIGIILNYLGVLGPLRDVERVTSKVRFLDVLDRVESIHSNDYLSSVQDKVTIQEHSMNTRRKSKADKHNKVAQNVNRSSVEDRTKEQNHESWARVVDLPGLEDNISPNNNIDTLCRFIINEICVVFSKSSDTVDRQYLVLRAGLITMDLALMTYGPAYQLSVNTILLTDKMHTTSSGQYLDLLYSPLPSNIDIITVLYRKVSAGCPDFWSHFHGVETSLVADFGNVNILLHQESIHTLIKYSKYFSDKMRPLLPPNFQSTLTGIYASIKNSLHNHTNVPVPPGSIKFSHSARLMDVNVRVCDSDFDIINITLSGLEMDFLFRANERFVFRSFLSKILVEHLSEITLYNKILYTEEDKVFEMKYVRHASNFKNAHDISPGREDNFTDGSFKFHLGQLHFTFLYKLIVQVQRFIVNLEALVYVNRLLLYLKKAVANATKSFQTSSRVQLSLNLCGPIFLFPQKSSSPNVLVIDTGDFHVENFFKEGPSDIVENILLKWSDITVSRGVMSLLSALQMQESLIEPFQLNVDIKKFTNEKTRQKTWEIDGVIDIIEITLGQKDLNTILSIYTENIGEGRIIDLLPVSTEADDRLQDNDETVKNLEAFFCEPRQRNVVAKFAMDGLKLSLFFDSGELLSSPMRDLNHGMCKLEICDLGLNSVSYTDGSLDGKLSVDSVTVTEIGPNSNSYDRSILQSPIDENKNNNCNITVNKPPIIDITFHQNKNRDKSMDIIVGRLGLNLSIPFCEKLAMFVLECLPKDIDLGFVNHGYEAEISPEPDAKVPACRGLTVSFRLNKPELVFFVESTSNTKRYFVTKCEVLADYSRHANRLNFAVSLSGLHTLFYDLGVHYLDPYVLLRHCDIELCKNYSEDKGTSISASISSIYVQICSAVVHSLNDILNDICEHFKVPLEEMNNLKMRRENSSNEEIEDLWEPKKLNDYVLKYSDSNDILTKRGNVHEVFVIPRFEIVVIFEMEEIQALLIKSSIEASVYNWSEILNCTCEVTLQANYFNEKLQCWEPLIDPVVIDEGEYKPWDVLIKVFQDKALPMLNSEEGKKRKRVPKTKASCTTTEDEDSGDDMMYLEPINNFPNRNNRRVKNSLSTFLDDSDSENEEGTMEKLAAAISDLFTGDWNEEEDSDCQQSSESEDTDNELKSPEPEEDLNYKKALYFLVDSKEVLNITLTPTVLKLLKDMFTLYSTKTLSIANDRNAIHLVNDIGPKSRIELYEKRTFDDKEDEDFLICAKTFENIDSAPNSPVKSNFSAFNNDQNNDKESNSDVQFETGYDFKTISTLQFPQESTSELYERMNKHFLKIYVPNFLLLQTNCSKSNWTKLLKLHPEAHMNQEFHLVAKHTVGKNGRSLTVGSPLNIKNETCYAINILYQPSILQQLNLEPVGDMTNPFETTMRIAILEPHEEFNVPLFIACYCKLFIQPAYAEGNYASSGIWWKDLTSELDSPYNLICKKKDSDKSEVFALRISMGKNLQLHKSNLPQLPNYIITLLPPLVINNYLPYAITITSDVSKQNTKIEPGEKSSIYNLDISNDQKLFVNVKWGSETWVGFFTLTTHLDEKFFVLTSSTSTSNKLLALNVRAERERSCQIFIYTSYWIVNKTGLPLKMKASASNTVMESNPNDILLFTYKRHGRQTLSVKVYDSNWSNEFGLECAGTTGLVVCKDNERKKKYLFFLTITLSKMCPRLTKVVTLLPSFLIRNETNKHLRIMEENEKTDLWNDIAPQQTVTFWPETSSMQMYVKYRQSKVISQPFFISTNHKTVLRMDKGGAITVEVTGGTSDSFKIIFYDFTPGDAPVLVQNYCSDLFLKIQQKDQSQVTLLSPYHSLLYTWDDPTRLRRLVWNVYNNKGSGFPLDTFKDGFGEERIRFHSVTPSTTTTLSSSEDSDSSDSVRTTLNKKVRKDKVVIYWLCYRNGYQRTLLFTQEFRIYNHVLKTVFEEKCNMELLLSMSSFGLSVFTSEYSKKEKVYLALSDMPAVWEVNVGHKWKTLTLELASWIEDKYKLQYKKCQLKDYIHIDFEKMFMLKPFFAELRRTYNPAVYFHLRRGNREQYYNLKVHALQIDNKDSNTIVLQPLPSLALKSYDPFLDVAISKTVTLNCSIYRYVKVTLGDFHLNVESDLLTDLNRLIGFGRKFAEDDEHTYASDMASIHGPVDGFKVKKFNQYSIVENFQLNGFNVKLNIANRSQIGVVISNVHFNKLLNFLFPLNISPYMPQEGVYHKISSIEEFNVVDSFWDVLGNVVQKIITQFLQQYYSHVLGLQVLVNTFAIQSFADIANSPCDPAQMASILYQGSRFLLGHVNMSPAALEQSVTDIFANQSIDCIQRIRRHGSYQKSDVIPRSITASCRNFHSGVPIALNQLIVRGQNVGIGNDGEMFFRTTGKVLLSLVTRHPDEKTDCVELAREALKRASILGEPIRIHQRLTRYRNMHTGLRPMSTYESLGQFLLETMANSRFSHDSYWAHGAVDKIGKSILILSLQHLVKINKCRLWGPWEIEWTIELDDIVSMPQVVDAEMILTLRPNKHRVSEELKIHGDREALIWLREKIEQAIILSMEDKSWTVTDK
ncbi:vacuolar protein sorting-associated protein 13A-like [Coccinella septempunctata]|uniref:vacuolar protein sorting-associated protein 13A-like n=1 Tax=Coccinella septempunctata TaxID=41139 RepID=UPI001D0845D9|nr:vacuolar protein sorting-associated protein 13A-like [Coccinella septempunctata]